MGTPSSATPAITLLTSGSLIRFPTASSETPRYSKDPPERSSSQEEPTEVDLDLRISAGSGTFFSAVSTSAEEMPARSLALQRFQVLDQLGLLLRREAQPKVP